MKKYRFIGTQEQATDYIKDIPIIGKIYSENDFVAQMPLKYWLTNATKKEWEEVTDKDVEKQEILDAVNKPLKALRYNNDKPTYSLLDLNALEPGVKVLEFGAVKYARDNWQKGFPFSTILDSMMRHIAALQRGEWIDPESGLPHIGHIQCNAMFLGGKNNTMDIEALKQPEECCGDWDNFGQCKCKENA